MEKAIKQKAKIMKTDIKQITNELLEKTVQTKASDQVLNFEIETDNNTKLYCSVNYAKSNFNYFTETFEPSRYYLTIQRQKRVMQAFTGLESNAGAINITLNEVTRKSNKQLKIAIQHIESALNKILEQYPKL